MSRFDLNLLGSLDALLRLKSVTGAAAEVGVSQPAMSGMLKRLRERLKDPILVRVGQSYELSERAQALSEPLRQVLLTVEDLTKPSDAVELVAIRRNIRVMAAEFSQIMILPRLFAQAGVDAPLLTFEVLPIFDPITRVYTGDVDLCLTAAPISDIPPSVAGLIRTQTVYEEGFVALVDREHPLGDCATAEELVAFPHVATEFPGVGKSVEEVVIVDSDIRQVPIIRVPSFLCVPPMILGTQRVCIQPAALVEHLCSWWPGLRAVALPDSYGSLALRMLWHVRFDMDPVHRWARSLLMDAANQLPGLEQVAPHGSIGMSAAFNRVQR